jgi:hypothetical protein
MFTLAVYTVYFMHIPYFNKALLYICTVKSNLAVHLPTYQILYYVEQILLHKTKRERCRNFKYILSFSSIFQQYL